jgi:Zn-dependent protease
VLFALNKPVSFAGLLLGFVLAMVVRGVVQRAVFARVSGRRAGLPVFDPKHDFDVYGIVGAALGGTGWGRRAPVAYGDYAPRYRVALSGPLVVLVLSQLALAACFAYTGSLAGFTALALSDTLHGLDFNDNVLQFLWALAGSLLAAGLLMLVPLPPLDGWGVLARRMGPRPSPGFAKAAHWLDDNHIGVVILLIGLALPIGGGASAVLLFLFNLISYPIFALWSAL